MFLSIQALGLTKHITTNERDRLNAVPSRITKNMWTILNSCQFINIVCEVFLQLIHHNNNANTHRFFVRSFSLSYYL